MKEDELDNCGRGGNGGSGNGSSTPPPNNTTENWLTIWESNMIAELEKSLNDPENNSIQAETQLCSQKIWQSFQNCATAVAQVYVERGNVTSNSGTTTTGDILPSSGKSSGAEEAFRLAAHHATTLYKDGVESCRRVGETGLRQGQALKTKEILQWVKRRRRFIRRDELIAMLAGSSSLPHQQQQGRRPSSLSEDHHHHYYHNSKSASGAFGIGAGHCGGVATNTTSTLTNISQPTNKPLLDSSNSFFGFNSTLDFANAASATDSFSTFRAAVVSSHIGGASNRRPSPPPNNDTDDILFSNEFQVRKRTSQLNIEDDDDDINMDSPNSHSHQQPKRGRFY